MRSIINEVHAHIKAILGVELTPGDWAPTPKRDLGDVAIPCFKISKAVGKTPAEVAKDLADQIAPLISTESLIEKVNATGPYLNVRFSAKNFSAELFQKLKCPATFGSSKIGANKSLVIDFSSPNIAKEMALHHLRSTAIGNALANIAGLHEFKVTRINYLGDWGTAHGKNILALQKYGSEAELIKKGVAYMLELYVRFNQAAKEHPELNTEAKAMFSALEKGDVEARRVWNLFRSLTIEEFKLTYTRLGILFDHFDGESLYEGDLEAKVNEISDSIGTRVSDGAIVCDLPGHELPVLLKKDDGASLYMTRDLVAIEDRYTRFHFDLNWYVVAVQQKLHFKQLFDLVTLMKKPFAGKSEHLSFGMLSFGQKTMKSREGNVIFLNDVLDEAKTRAADIIRAKNPNLKDLDAVAEMIGSGAILFFDLSQNRNHDIRFEWEKALSFEGDTAPFVQYAHARCTSLIQKGSAHLATLDIKITGDLEELQNNLAVRQLVGDLMFFELYSERALNDRDPSQIATAVLNVAKSLNQLYHKIRFLDERSPTRLRYLLDLCEGTQKVLAHGLGLLGIRAPHEM